MLKSGEILERFWYKPGGKLEGMGGQEGTLLTPALLHKPNAFVEAATDTREQHQEWDKQV